MKHFRKLAFMSVLLFIIALICNDKPAFAGPQDQTAPDIQNTLNEIKKTQKEILNKLNELEKKVSSAAPQARPSVDPNKVHNIPVGNSHVKGNKNAPVTITEFSDFQCPFCAQLQLTLSEVLKAYPKEVKLIFKQYPLPFHPQAKNAAKATLAAMEQGKFWEMHDAIFGNFSQLSNENFRELASQIGLNMEKFIADYNSDKYEPQLLQDFNAAD